MADMPAPRPAPLEAVRERVINQLAEHYAYDNLSESELESRLERAARADSLEELASLVSGLPALRPATGLDYPGHTGGMEYPARVADKQVIVAVMGGANRKGRWTPPERLFVVAMMGGAELDFRDARLRPGVTEVTIFAMMGGVEIIVPPGVEVEMNGLALMGAFEEREDASLPPSYGGPILRIGGFAMMGGVEVKYRFPGEKSKDARERLKEHRRRFREGHRRLPGYYRHDDDD